MPGKMVPGSDFEASDFDEVLAAVLAAEVPTEVTGSKDGGKWRGLLPPAMRSRDLLPTAGRPEDSAVGGAAAGGGRMEVGGGTAKAALAVHVDVAIGCGAKGVRTLVWGGVEEIARCS